MNLVSETYDEVLGLIDTGIERLDSILFDLLYSQTQELRKVQKSSGNSNGETKSPDLSEFKEKEKKLRQARRALEKARSSLL